MKAKELFCYFSSLPSARKPDLDVEKLAHQHFKDGNSEVGDA